MSVAVAGALFALIGFAVFAARRLQKLGDVLLGARKIVQGRVALVLRMPQSAFRGLQRGRGR